ncbi:threonine synthase [Helicobacter sp. MIT 14-3879]|uniref:threonine synthase n=1 Tax=Helicobacter sp. MIT 14-3879 TaxID=2040649 RepID=UPI000E1E74CD|nr:threonine synthase [Helicobacter sp. MIT 14-3879]RDU65585.1 threonine synthase [Helicobacter sp. MIT 14-3879]
MLVETRGNNKLRSSKCSFFEAILNPQASFNGLWSLETIPKIDIKDIQNLSYNDLLKFVFKTIDVDSSLIDKALNSYKNFDNSDMPLNYNKISSSLFIQNLFTGPTRAFKDMAMQPFCSLLCDLSLIENKKYLILTATSGDTGPSTLEAIKNKPNIYGICMYPNNGTSDVQRRQMTTIDAKNIRVIAIDGNFDDAQNTLKTLLSSNEFRNFTTKRGFFISATNSVNFGRIAFQIIYHIHSYLYLLNNGCIKHNETINIIVPSGNFGNALGAFYAKLMGVPINKIIIATNANDVLCEFINKGVYDISSRHLIKTNSPAMDILKSSNIERVLFHLFGDIRTKELMESLEINKKYILNTEELLTIQQYFSAYSFSDNDVLNIIKDYASKNIIIDPHTANGILAYEKNKDVYKNHSTYIKSIVCSTAEWSKFATTISKALGQNLNDKDSIEFICKNYNLELHQNIAKLFNKNETNNIILKKEQIQDYIYSFLDSIKD